MNKLMPIIILSLLLVTCTSCTKNSKLASNSKDGGSTSAMVQKGRLGNTNYNIANGGRIDEENGWIYYSLDDGLYKCLENGSKNTKLLDSDYGFYDINVIGEWIYFRNFGIYRIKTDGTCYEQIADEDVRGGVHFIDGKIYNGSEYRMNFDGSEKEHIYDKNVACGYTLNIVDNYIYFFDTEYYRKDDKIFRMKMDGSDLKAIYDGRTDHMIVDNDWIYFADYDDKDLYKMKTDGTEKTFITEGFVNGILENDDWIYYISEGCIYKIKTNGTQKQLLIDVKENDVPEIQLQGDWLYYEIDDKIYRLKTDGTEHQLFAKLDEEFSKK